MDNTQSVNDRLDRIDQENSKRPRSLREAIEKRARLQIRYKGHLRWLYRTESGSKTTAAFWLRDSSWGEAAIGQLTMTRLPGEVAVLFQAHWAAGRAGPTLSWRTSNRSNPLAASFNQDAISTRTQPVDTAKSSPRSISKHA